MKQLLPLLQSWSSIETPFEETKYMNLSTYPLDYSDWLFLGQLPRKEL